MAEGSADAMLQSPDNAGDTELATEEDEPYVQTNSKSKKRTSQKSAGGGMRY